MNQTYQMAFSDELGANIFSGVSFTTDAQRQNANPFANPTYTPAPIVFNTYPTPYQNNPPVRTTGTSIKLNDILQNGVGLASQIISAFGRNPNQQILTGSGAIVPITPQAPSPYGSGGYTPAQQAEIAERRQLGVGENAVETGKGFFDGIAKSFGISTTMLLVGAGVGWYLLQKEPKKRR